MISLIVLLPVLLSDIGNDLAENSLEYSVINRQIPNREDTYAFLVAYDPPLDVPLGPVSRFDPKTLCVEWIHPHKTLHVQWTSIPMGQGAYRGEAHVILAVRGDTNEELLRVAYFSGHEGAESHEITTCSVEPGASANRFLFHVEQRVSHIFDFAQLSQQPEPLARLEDPGGPWFQQYVLRETTEYDTRRWLMYCGRSATVDLLDAQATGDELASFLVLLLAPRWRKAPGMGVCTAEERAAMLDATHLVPTETYTGTIPLPIRSVRNIIAPMTPLNEYWPFGEPQVG